MRPNLQNQTDIDVDNIRHQGQGQNQGLFKFKVTKNREVKNVHRPKGPSSSRFSFRSVLWSMSRKRKRSRSHKSRRSKKHYASSSDTDISHRHHRHGDPRKHPKGLRFEGKSNWRSFKKRFDSYRKVMKWSDTQWSDTLLTSIALQSIIMSQRDGCIFKLFGFPSSVRCFKEP